MFNKRIAACLAAAVLMFGGAAAVFANRGTTQPAASAEYNGSLRYSSVSGGVAITAYTGSGGAVDIPSKINGSKVVAIADNAFFQCDAITSVNIPDTVKTIGDNAFFYCTSMSGVTIPDSVTEIGVCAFSGCAKIKTIKLPKSLKTVKEAAFSDCTGLNSVTIPDADIRFKYEAFLGCTSLKEIVIPKKVNGIEDKAFGFCITDSENVLYKGLSGFKIKCYMNSDAYIYAVENGLKYEILDPETPDKIYNIEVVIPDEPEEPDDDTTGDESVKGDINGDGVVNVTDLSVIVGQIKRTTQPNYKLLRKADINGDGRVNVTDISLISAHIKGVKKF